VELRVVADMQAHARGKKNMGHISSPLTNCHRLFFPECDRLVKWIDKAVMML
jgi:hypothetical protein